MMYFPVMDLQTLFRSEGRFTAFMLAQKWFGPDVDEHVLFQIGMLSKLFLAKAASVFGLFLMDFTYMAVESVFGAKDELTFHTMKLPRSFVDLFNVLSEGLGVQVDFSAFFAGLFQGLFFGVYPVFMLDKTEM